MSNFIDRVLGRNPKGTSNTAKERLQVVLIHDRFNLPPEKMREMKEEIMAVISKYVEIDRESVDIALEQRDRNNSKIRAEIPFTPGKRVADPDEDVPDFVTASTIADKALAEKPTSPVEEKPSEPAHPSGTSPDTKDSSST